APSDFGAGGAGSCAQLRPPSSVLHSCRHDPVRHGAVPSTHPVASETNDTDVTLNVAGSPGPAAVAGPVVLLEESVAGEVACDDVVEAVDGVVTGELEGGFGGDPVR